jgi:hypothetical protein
MLLQKLKRLFKSNKSFPGSADYWEQRYQAGGNSGGGSYNRLAEFKAEVLNAFLKQHPIKMAMEFGCGDGNQLTLLHYPNYIGLDVSKTVIGQCIARFKADQTKSFFLYDSFAFLDRARIFQADLTLSLDVLFHLVEDEVFEAYMRHLFAASTKYVIIYATNQDQTRYFHVKHRSFTNWVAQHQPAWKLIEQTPNRFPHDPKDPVNTSDAGFFVFQKQG